RAAATARATTRTRRIRPGTLVSACHTLPPVDRDDEGAVPPACTDSVGVLTSPAALASASPLRTASPRAFVVVGVVFDPALAPRFTVVGVADDPGRAGLFTVVVVGATGDAPGRRAVTRIARNAWSPVGLMVLVPTRTLQFVKLGTPSWGTASPG